MDTLWDQFQALRRQKAEWLDEASSCAGKDIADRAETTPDPPSDWIPRLPCPVCHGVVFWRSIHGAVACTKCKPPAASYLVDKTVIATQSQDPRARLHALLDRWAAIDEAEWAQEAIDILKDRILDFWGRHPADADQWWREWRAAHPHARLV